MQQVTGLDQIRARKVPGVTVVDNAAPATGPIVWVAFNMKNPKLADKRVRQAISFAIDRDFIVKGIAGSTVKRATGPISSGSIFYTSEVEKYDHNLTKAAQLMDEAGLKPGADGIRMALEIDCPPGFASLKAVQEYLKPALAKIGVNVLLRNSPDFPTWARRVSSYQYEATVDSAWNWGDPVIGVHRTYLTSNIKPGVIWSNTHQYSNPKVDELLNAAAKETNLGKRKSQYKEMQKIVVDECPLLFLVESTWLEVYARKVDSPPNGIWGVMDTMAETGMRKA